MNARQTQPAEMTGRDQAVLSWPVFFLLLLATGGGVLITTLLLPGWAPGLVNSLLGSQPKAYWYLARASALVAYAWLWLSMVFGLGITNRMARLWPGGPAALDLHQYAGLIGLSFAAFHGLILLGDRYAGFRLLEILLPFASYRYRPAAVGVGQAALYGWLIVAFSFYARKKIGPRTWRLIHFGSFFTYAMALLHALSAGTDTSIPVVQTLYWISAGVLLWLTLYRLLGKTVSRVFSPRA